MESSAELIILWKAPQSGRDAGVELRIGFNPDAYPVLGPFFTTELFVALEFQATYKNGLQEIRVPRSLIDEWLKHGVLQEDPYYPPGISYHVPAAKLSGFNQYLPSLVTRFHSSDEINHG